MNAKTDTAPDASLRLVITRTLNAPSAMVYRAWTDPKQMLKWWGPENIECKSIETDVRVGGAFRIHMDSPRGEHIASGKYLEVVPNKKLRFSWDWQHYHMPNSVLTIDLEDLGQSTRLTLTHEGLPDQEDVQEHTHGWTSLADKLVRLCDSQGLK
jgi:uncharacterized protein YndB with AHSA1/START domain